MVMHGGGLVVITYICLANTCCHIDARRRRHRLGRDFARQRRLRALIRVVVRTGRSYSLNRLWSVVIT